MTTPEWITLQQQLWDTFGYLIFWWFAALAAGLVGSAALLFGLIYFSDWLG